MPLPAPDPSLLQALRVFRVRLAELAADLDPATVHPSDAVAVVEEVSALERQLAGLRLVCAPRAADSPAVKRTGHRSAEHWYAERAGVGLQAARRSLATGRRLQHLDDTRRRAMAGDLSEAQIDRVADAASHNPGCESAVLQAAGARSFRGLADACDRAKAEATREEDAVARVDAAHRRRFLRHGLTADGAFRLEVHTTVDAGARVMAAIDRRAQAVFAEARRQGRREPHHAYQVDALVDLVTRSGVPDAGPATASGTPMPAVGEPAAAGCREGTHLASADFTEPAPAALPSSGQVRRPPHPAAAALADPSPPPRPQGGGPGNEALPRGDGQGTDPPVATITFLVDVEALRRGHLTSGERCELAGVGPVPLATVEHYFGRSRLDLVVRRGTDVASVVSLGRAIPRALRVALGVRDRTCVVPGCDVTSPLEIDHVVPFASGGPTRLDNLCRLCPHHHDLKTYRGYVLRAEAGRWHFDPPATPDTSTRSPAPRRPTRRSTRRGNAATGTPAPQPATVAAGQSRDDATLFG